MSCRHALVVLAGLALLAVGLLLSKGGTAAVRASLWVSLLWLLGGAFAAVGATLVGLLRRDRDDRPAEQVAAHRG